MQFYALSLGVTNSPYSEIRLANKPERSAPPKCAFCGTGLALGFACHRIDIGSYAGMNPATC